MAKKRLLKKSKKKIRTKTPDSKVKNAMKKINILILGPGYPPNELKKRKQIKDELRKQGFKAYVMEENPQPERQITHVDKFDELLDMKNLLCVAISTPKGYSNGLSFEIGYICGSFGRTEKGQKRLQNELGFIISKKADRSKILSSYVTTGLFYDGISMQYEYSTTKQIVEHIKTMTKIRARKLRLF